MKKVLSFVLVLAMILGSVAMVSAADFSDNSAITNKEAAAVLSAAGILEGYTDGSFKPAGILTRAEGAAIAARLVLGKAEAAKLTTVVAPFNDVPATHWAAGYISYCVSQGYLNGYGNGNFGPEDTLTVAQFGKMMLTLLGYKSENEGFIGDAWETNVGSVMVKAGLTDGVTLSGSNACAREVAAQVALNTLKGELVKYEGNPVSVSAGSVTVVTGQSAAKKDDWQSGDKGYAAPGNYKGETRANANVRFINRYQKKLDYSADNGDKFGRPDTYTWRYDGEKAYTKKDSEHLIATYTTKQTVKTLYELLDSKDALKPTTTTFWLDGVTKAGIVLPNSKTSTAEWKYDGANTLGNGAQLEVYYDKTAKNLTFVAYRYYLVQANADYNTTKKSVKVSKVSQTMPAVVDLELASKDFAVENVKADDYLVVTVAGNEIKSVVPATKVTGVMSTYTSGTDATIDGTKYTIASTEAREAGALTNISAGNTLTAVLDPNNFLFKTTDEVVSNQYVYIYKSANETNLAESVVATAYFVDGSKSTITVKKVNATSNPTKGAVTTGWWNYTVDSEGKYTLKTIAGTTAPDGVVHLPLDAGKVNYVAGKTASNDTVFIVRTTNDTKMYTGYKAAPGTTNAVTSAALVKDAIAKYVFVDAAGETLKGAKTTDYIFVFKTGALKTVGTSGDDYYTYGDMFLNGTKQTGEFSTNMATGTLTTAAIGLYTDLGYSDGRIDSAVNALKVNGDNVGGFEVYDTLATGAAISYVNGTLKLNAKSFAVDDNATAFIIDKADKSASEAYTASQVVKNLDETGVAGYLAYIVFTDTTADKIVKTIYFVAY